jgi:hypothetical protein
MYRDEIRITTAITLVEEVFQPLPTRLCASNSRRTQFDAEFLQRLNLGFPASGCCGDGEVGTTSAVATIGLVEAKDLAYVVSVGDLLLD